MFFALESWNKAELGFAGSNIDIFYSADMLQESKQVWFVLKILAGKHVEKTECQTKAFNRISKSDLFPSSWGCLEKKIVKQSRLSCIPLWLIACSEFSYFFKKKTLQLIVCLYNSECHLFLEN